MPFLLGGLILGGGLLNYFGGKQTAEANEAISLAQLQAAIENRNLAMGAAAPTANELALQESQLNFLADYFDQSQAMLDKSFALADAIDPTITESARQSYQLMMGQDSASLAPLKAEQERQRQRLELQLRDQMGGGFAGTSAGQNAVMQFNTRANEQMQMARDAKLGQLLGVATAGAGMFSNIGAQQNAAAGTFGALSSNALAGIQGTQNRMVGAITGTNITPYAGAQFVGDAGSGAAMSGLGSLLGNIGGMGLGSMLGGGSQRVSGTARGFQSGFTPY